MRVRKANQVNVIHEVRDGQVYYGRIYLDRDWEPGLDYWPLNQVPLEIFHRDVFQADGIKDAQGKLIYGEDWEEPR